MWKYLINRRVRRETARSAPVTPADIEAASTILFSVFARYGDSVIAFKCIDRFMSRHPGKRYLLITTHQALPYAELLIRHPIEIHSVNKRHDPLRMARLVLALQKNPPDLGLNPWSHGRESEYFISFCRKFWVYGLYDHYTKKDNLYRRAQLYLSLPPPEPTALAHGAVAARSILVSPISTDVRKSLGRADVEVLVAKLAQTYPGAAITLAVAANELDAVRGVRAELFVYGKTRARSLAFLELLRNTDLFVSVDAGPLHLADAMGIRTVGIFGPTAPDTILDRDSGVLPLRLPALDGYFCNVPSCKNPICIQRLIAQTDLKTPVPVHFDRSLSLEERTCRVDPEHI
jgi:hypothetical protein